MAVRSRLESERRLSERFGVSRVETRLFRDQLKRQRRLADRVGNPHMAREEHQAVVEAVAAGDAATRTDIPTERWKESARTDAYLCRRAPASALCTTGTT